MQKTVIADVPAVLGIHNLPSGTDRLSNANENKE